jgi:aspartate/methionine/tyrosine aminotransferase
MHPNKFHLEATFEKYENQKGMNVLGASDAEPLTFQQLLRMAQPRLSLRALRLNYGDVKGLEELREAVAKSYSRTNVKKENVLITVGASEAIFLALHTLLKPGDRALVCKPAYQSLSEMASAAGAKVIEYEYLEQRQFASDLEKLQQLLKRKPAPRVLVINSPHNPTGQMLDETTLKELLASARRVGTQVVVDEVFRGVVIESAAVVPSATAFDPKAIVIGSLSKVYGLAGLRVGWLVGPEEFIRDSINLRYYTSLVPPSIVQQLAVVALRNRKSILAKTQHNVTRNYEYAKRWLTANNDIVDWIPAQAGLVMLLKVKSKNDTATFAGQLATSCKVFLVPCSTGFDMPEGYLRLGLGGAPAKFRQGLTLFGDFLRTGKCRKTITHKKVR